MLQQPLRRMLYPPKSLPPRGSCAPRERGGADILRQRIPTPAEPQRCGRGLPAAPLTCQLVGLQPALRVDAAQHEVVGEAARSRCGPGAAAPAHAGGSGGCCCCRARLGRGPGPSRRRRPSAPAGPRRRAPSDGGGGSGSGGPAVS